jgi:integrase
MGKLSALHLTRKNMESGWYGDGHGLYLQVGGNQAKSWLFRYMVKGKARGMGLGPVHTVSLAEAREKARAARKLLLDGIDPLEAREQLRATVGLQKAKSMSFDACAAAYIKAHRAGWKNAKHVAQWESTLTAYAGPVFGELPVSAVDTALVMKALEPIWTEIPETASRVRGRIESVLDWATVRGYRSGENPARWRGHLDKLLPKRSSIRRVKHHPALPYAEMSEFMATLRGEKGLAARALEFTILTATRTGEIIGARWEEFNLAEKLWVVPLDRMKAKKEHRVPLSREALAVLSALPHTGELVFPLSNMVMLELLKRIGRADLTVHGFRSSFRDWAAECTGYPGEVAEAALAHVLEDKVEAAYRRGDLFDKRRQLMSDWAKYCSRKPGEVVELASRKTRALGWPEEAEWAGGADPA